MRVCFSFNLIICSHGRLLPSYRQGSPSRHALTSTLARDLVYIGLSAAWVLMALFGMTPYAWKTPREGVERLRDLDTLETQVGFDLHLYEKE